MHRPQMRQALRVKEFTALPSWEERYRKLIELGRKLPDLPEELRTEEAKVKGCQSQVWLHASLNSSGEVILRGDSDALLVKGLLALVLEFYSESTPQEILESPASFLTELGFAQNLTPSRANGLAAMLKQIKLFAQAYLMLFDGAKKR